MSFPISATLATSSPTPLPGELWLLGRTSGAPQRAVVASPRAAGDLSDHKLVLGPAGSGRSLMLARLGRAAHAAGNSVVAIEQTARGEASPLHQLTARLGGAVCELNAAVGFNPFWVPGSGPLGWAPPADNVIDQLFHLLLALFDFETPVATRPKLRLRVLGHVLRRYYDRWAQPDSYWNPARDFWQTRAGHPDQQWHEGPSFNSFFEFMMLESGSNRHADFEEPYTWLLATSAKYYAGSAYDYLLNALPARQSQLLTNPARCFYFGWPATTASAAVKRAYWVLLYSLDTHVTHASWPSVPQRLTIITNGLPVDTIEETELDMTYIHLRSWRSFDRELVVGSTQLPVWSLIDDLATKLLLAGCPCPVAVPNELGLCTERVAQLRQLNPENREVALLVGQRFTVYSARLSPEELAFYQPQ